MSYCEDIVRRHDPDRYRLALSQAPRHQAALLALFAFNHEIAKTREVVSDPTLGYIRLQWWRDAVAKMAAGEVMGHEVLGALSSAFFPSPLGERVLMEDIINAREFDLENRALESLDALEDYADKTSTPLNRLALQALGQEQSAVRAVSIAYALTGLLRAQPYLTERSFLPHGVSAADTARRARYYLENAGPLHGYLKAVARLTALYLDRMERAKFAFNDARINLPPWSFSLAALVGRFR